MDLKKIKANFAAPKRRSLEKARFLKCCHFCILHCSRNTPYKNRSKWKGLYCC